MTTFHFPCTQVPYQAIRSGRCISSSSFKSTLVSCIGSDDVPLINGPVAHVVLAGSGWITDWFHRYPQGLSAGHTPEVPLARGHPQMLLREVAQGLDIVKTQILTMQCAILRYITATIQ